MKKAATRPTAPRSVTPLLLACATVVLGACAPGGHGASDRSRSAALAEPEAFSLLDRRPFRQPVFTPERRRALEGDLAAARAAFDADPASEEASIWVGRRLAYLGRHREAVEWYTRALERFPESPRLLRHRGHRFITLRRFDEAFSDLERAATIVLERGIPDEVEPDGAPNASGAPRSTLHSNIQYHLGLAAYLRGEFARAALVWDNAVRTMAMNDDTLVAFAYWRFNARTRLGHETVAMSELEGIRPDMDILENFAYHRLLLVFKGERSEAWALDAARAPGVGGGGAVDDATTSYGLANRRLTRFDLAGATALMERLVASDQWAAFGFIAAEVDLVRLRRGELNPEPATPGADDTIRQWQRQRR
ncbi:MAG TPA: hypothetical protein DEB06_10655 [Phycisphaerales bacterium]|nr:hypothetical protein [Phycisphaerales bacterium]